MEHGVGPEDSLACFWGRWKELQCELDRAFARYIPHFFSGFAAEEVERIAALVGGGKRVRGGLLCLVSEALGGEVEEAASFALALECVQAATLIHDDFIDADTERRSAPALWTIQGPRRAVLLGDIIFARAVQQVTSRDPEAGSALASAIAITAQGAYQEFIDADALAGQSAYEPRGYERILHLKTGALFGAAAQLGALAAGCGEANGDVAFRYGNHLGMAYQVADDLQDLKRFSRQSPNPSRLIALAPALFYFSLPRSPEEVLRQSKGDLQSWLERRCSVLIQRMDRDIERRLRLAAMEAGRLGDAEQQKALLIAGPALVGMMREPG